MTIRIGINGFGRIGRLVARALAEYNINDVQLVAINSPGDISTSAHLLRYDSVHGRFKTEVIEGDNFIDYGRGKIRMTHERDPSNIAWGDLNIDVVMECTGIFRSKKDVQSHFEAGAKKCSSPLLGKMQIKLLFMELTIMILPTKIKSCLVLLVQRIASRRLPK